MNKPQGFWAVMELCDWSHEGDDNKVLAPLIQYLSQQEDEIIFQFDDQMSELLYQLDTRKLAAQCEQMEPNMSGDSFLYSRCVALLNGSEYYEQARLGRRKEIWTMEFEALLYVPSRAWAKRHKKPEEEYPHIPPLSYETGINQEQWK
ncbi:DUF4240 domain-containing protein [Flintibacter muris]|uniref:DUF4240 domain-containing protein n=1 Tax=Flintibacter muris TaxID=2941327 RepID=UPI00203EE9CE|nr:DUF4240 domain-containing protein [Flintibacter muris]